MTIASSLTFQKILPLKKVTIAGVICCCPASVPYSLPLPPQVRQQGKKIGLFLSTTTTQGSVHLQKDWYRSDFS